MKKIILITSLLLISTNLVFAALTVGNIPRTKTGGTTPALQDSAISQLGSNIGIGSTVPGAMLDVQGTVRAIVFSGTIPSSTISGVIPISNLATGTPSGNKFVRDDGTLQVPPGNGSTQWATAGSDINFTGGNVGIGTSITTQLLDVKGGDLDINLNSFRSERITNPASAPTLSSGGAGSLTGAYKYGYSYYTATGETSISSLSGTYNAVSEKITVTFAVSPDSRVVGRKIYRNVDSGTNYFFINTVTNNIAVTYVDNASDNSISSNNRAEDEAQQQKKDNTTGGINKYKENGLDHVSSFVGDSNTYMGEDAGNVGTVTGGYQNTAYGAGAFSANQDGARDTAIGNLSMNILKKGEFNTGLGNYSLANLYGGDNNDAIGYASQRSIQAGQYNESMGSRALYTLGQRFQAAILDITDYSGTVAGTIKINSPSYPLITGDTIDIHGTSGYDANGYTVTTIDTDNFYVTATFKAEETKGSWCLSGWADGTIGIGGNALASTYFDNYDTFIGYNSGNLSDQTGFVQITPEVLSYAIAIGANAQAGLSNIMNIGGNDGSAGNVKVGISTHKPLHDLSFGGSIARTIGVERPVSNSSAGSNLTINAGGSTVSGAITTLSTTPTAGGTGYKIGNTLTITTGGSGATAVVTNASSGIVTKVMLLLSGSGYTTGTGKSTTGGGSGCTVNITAVNSATDLAGGDLILQGGTGVGTGASAVRIYTATAGSTGTTDTAPTEKVSIFGSGNVGIGTTGAAPNKLYVVGTPMFTTGLSIGIGTTAPTRLCIANNVVATCP